MSEALEELFLFGEEKMEKAVTGLHEEILSAMAELREVVDRLEKIVSDTLWPLPKYREMLFIK